MFLNYVIVFLLTLIVSTIMVPFVIRFAKKIGAVDKPDKRKVHVAVMPRIGGVAIYIAFLVGFIYISTFFKLPISIVIGATIIALTGFIDDKFQIKPWQKLIGQFAATAVILSDGLFIKYLTVPFLE